MSDSCLLVLIRVGLVLTRVDSCWVMLTRIALCWYLCIRIDLTVILGDIDKYCTKHLNSALIKRLTKLKKLSDEHYVAVKKLKGCTTWTEDSCHVYPARLCNNQNCVRKQKHQVNA